jgi:RHS repeat-associated protein
VFDVGTDSAHARVMRRRICGSRFVVLALFRLFAVVAVMVASRREALAQNVDFTSVPLPPGPGSVRGLAESGQVQPETGAYTYSMPIDVPDYAGLKPNLSLGYSSVAGTGPLGGGWNVIVPFIRRSTRSGIPSYTSRDQLELSGLEGGGRLVPDTSQANWYWVEGHGRKLRVRFVNGTSYEVTDENGNVYMFGADASSQLVAPDNVRVAEWHLQTVTTLAGTRITYGYLRDVQQIYPSSIVWGPLQSGTPVFRVDFSYERRPDSSTSYRYGFRSTMRLRMTRVSVSSFGQVAHSLGFTYTPGVGLSRIASIQQYGRAGAAGIPPLNLTYANASSMPSLPSGDFNGWTPGLNTGVIWLDLDRDGYADLIQFDGTGTCPYRRNVGGSFAKPVNIPCPSLTLPQIDIADFDGDGFLDLATKPPTATLYSVYTVNNASFQSVGTWPGTKWMQHGTTFVDINGDGRADAIAKVNSNFTYGLNTAAGFAAPITVTPNTTNQLGALDVRRMVDFNRDGIVDYYTIQNNTLSLYYGKGDMTFDHFADVPFVTNQSSSTLANSPDRLRFSDFDNDGVIDAVEISTVLDFYRGHGDMGGFDARVTINGGDMVKGGVVDLDGNGTLDPFLFTSDRRISYTDLAGSAGTGQGAFIHRLDNGLGAFVYVDYDSTGDLNHIDALAGTPWSAYLPIAFPVCTSVGTYFGPSAPGRTVWHHPSSPVWDPKERSFAGFSSEVTTYEGASNADTLEVTSVFLPGLDASRELRGMLQDQSRQDGNGNALGASFPSWATQRVASLPNDPLLYVPIKQSEIDTVDGNPSVLSSTSYDYDSEGRLVRSTEAGRWDMSGDERIQEWDYVTPDDTTWVRDKICASRVKRGDGTQIADSQFLYGDNTSVAPLCQPGRGWPRQVSRYLDTDARYVTTWSQGYDAVGNATVTYDGHVKTEVAFDSLQLRPTARTITVVKGTQLRWITQWDNVVGRSTQVTAPNGTVDHYTYDDFGRLQTAAKDNLPPHLHYEYAWNGSIDGSVLPTTKEWLFDGDTTDLVSSDQVWPNGSKWRDITHVMNGVLEPIYASVWAGNGQYKVSEYVVRDARGRVAQAYEPFYSSTPFPTAVAPNTAVVSRTFDALGRPSTQTAPNGAQTTYTYNAYAHTVNYPDVSPHTVEYDGLSRLIHAERTADGGLQTADYTYDPYDNVTAISLQNGQVQTSYAYDSLARLRSATDPDTGYQTWTYNDQGHVLTHGNGANDTTHFGWDAAGRLTRKGPGPTNDDVNDYIYHYDQPRQPTDLLVKGRLSWVQEPNGELELSYDQFGNARYKKRTVNGMVGTRSTAYSPSGLRLRESFDDGFSYANSFDPAGRLMAIGNYWTEDFIDAADRSAVEHYGNGVHQAQYFDVVGLPQEIIVRRPNGAAMLDVGIQRLPSGRPYEMDDYDAVGLERSASFVYDDAGRLILSDYYTASDPSAERWYSAAYDSLENVQYRNSSGDPSSSTLVNGSFNYGENGHGPRQLTSITPWGSNPMPTQFDYDGAGRQIKEYDARLSYDAFDRLASITTPPGGVGPGNRSVNERFTYGADGLRTSVTDAQGVRETWFDSDWRDVEGVRQHFLSVGPRLVAQVQSSAGAISAVYLHQGLSAGPELMTTDGGVIGEERLYEPYGQPELSNNGSFDFTDRPMNGLNQPTDSGSGFSFHGARWYSTEVGRWLTPDPSVAGPSPESLAHPWTINPYQYADHDPLMFWDADGRRPYPFTYNSIEAARVDASSDILIQFLNNGIEYRTRIYRSEEGDYFYVTPWTGTESSPLGAPHSVDLTNAPKSGDLPEGAQPVYDEHGHPTYPYFSGQDLENAAPWLADRGMGMGMVDFNGDIHSVIDGKDVIVGHVDADTLAKLQAYKQAREEEAADAAAADAEAMARMDEALNTMSAEFTEADQTAAFMYKMYQIYNDPGAYAAAKGEQIENTSCILCLFNPSTWF